MRLREVADPRRDPVMFVQQESARMQLGNLLQACRSIVCGEGLERAGVGIAERLPFESVPTPENIAYLRYKKQILGQWLTTV